MSQPHSYFSYTYSGDELSQDLSPSSEASLPPQLSDFGIDSNELIPEVVASRLRARGHLHISRIEATQDEVSFNYHFGKLMGMLPLQQVEMLPAELAADDAHGMQQLANWVTHEPLARQYLVRCGAAFSFFSFIKMAWLAHSTRPSAEPSPDGMRYILSDDASEWHLSSALMGQVNKDIVCKEVIELPNYLLISTPDGQQGRVTTSYKRPLAVIELKSRISIREARIHHVLEDCHLSAFDELAIKIIGDRPQFKKNALWIYQSLLKALELSKPE